jgi:hypothetical protein
VLLLVQPLGLVSQLLLLLLNLLGVSLLAWLLLPLGLVLKVGQQVAQ